MPLREAPIRREAWLSGASIELFGRMADGSKERIDPSEMAIADFSSMADGDLMRILRMYSFFIWRDGKFVEGPNGTEDPYGNPEPISDPAPTAESQLDEALNGL